MSSDHYDHIKKQVIPLHDLNDIPLRNAEVRVPKQRFGIEERFEAEVLLVHLQFAFYQYQSILQGTVVLIYVCHFHFFMDQTAAACLYFHSRLVLQLTGALCVQGVAVQLQSYVLHFCRVQQFLKFY